MTAAGKASGQGPRDPRHGYGVDPDYVPPEPEADRPDPSGEEDRDAPRTDIQRPRANPGQDDPPPPDGPVPEE